MNQRLQKINEEIDKIKRKLVNYQSRLRDLERKKTELENADIIALVRGIDVPPDALADIVRVYKEKQADHAVPDISENKTEASKEDKPVEN